MPRTRSWVRRHDALHGPRCLNPGHHHPGPSPLQKAVASLLPHAVALWSTLMARNALHSGTRIAAGKRVRADIGTWVRKHCRGRTKVVRRWVEAPDRWPGWSSEPHLLFESDDEASMFRLTCI